MHLTYSPSGRRSEQGGQKIISKLILVYWRLLLANERDEWYLLADDLKLLKEINRNDSRTAIAQCAVVASKFAARPYIHPSARKLQEIDGKIGARLRFPSLASKGSKHRHLLNELLPMIEVRARDFHAHGEDGTAVSMEGPTLERVSQPQLRQCFSDGMLVMKLARVSRDSSVANGTMPQQVYLPPILEILGRTQTAPR